MFNSQFSIPIGDEVQTLGGFPWMRIENWELNIGQIRFLFGHDLFHVLLLQDTMNERVNELRPDCRAVCGRPVFS